MRVERINLLVLRNLGNQPRKREARKLHGVLVFQSKADSAFSPCN